jgi:flagellar basal-body rod protein FlgC
MIDPLQASAQIASSGLEAQSIRLRVVSENLANANSTGRTPGSEPYRRKTTTFTAEMDRAAGVPVVKIKDIGVDRAPVPGRLRTDPPGGRSGRLCQAAERQFADRNG